MSYETPKWTVDCQGKQDMDDDLVQLSTRFYPGNYQRNGQCSTIASIYFGADRIAEAAFEAPSEGEVKALTEAWARATVMRMETAIKAVFRDGMT